MPEKILLNYFKTDKYRKGGVQWAGGIKTMHNSKLYWSSLNVKNDEEIENLRDGGYLEAHYLFVFQTFGYKKFMWN